MAKQKRYPLLLDTEYPPQREVLGAVNSVPEGERAGVIRVLILLGHTEVERQYQKEEHTAEGHANGAGKD